MDSLSDYYSTRLLIGKHSLPLLAQDLILGVCVFVFWFVRCSAEDYGRKRSQSRCPPCVRLLLQKKRKKKAELWPLDRTCNTETGGRHSAVRRGPTCAPACTRPYQNRKSSRSPRPLPPSSSLQSRLAGKRPRAGGGSQRAATNYTHTHAAAAPRSGSGSGFLKIPYLYFKVAPRSHCRRASVFVPAPQRGRPRRFQLLFFSFFFSRAET